MQQTIAEYQTSRAASNAVVVQELPEVRPYARRHVAQLQSEGAGISALIERQLRREAESRRRVADEDGLQEHAAAFNRDALQAGLNAFREALATGKKTKLKVSKIEHKGGRYNPVNGLTIEDQASDTWAAIVFAAGRMADSSRPFSVQTLAGLLGGRLRKRLGGAPEYGELGYERAALLLLDHFGAATGWLEEKTGDLKLMSKMRKPNSYALTGKFIGEVLGGGVAVDFSERRPMLVRPVPWSTTTTHGGYLHEAIPAVRGVVKPIDSPVIASALNALQDTAFRVNRRVLALAETFTQNAEDLQGRMILGRYLEARHDQTDNTQQAKTIRSALTIAAMRELRNEEAFYFPWNLDWRGRMYPATSIISPQGADLCKGCLEFADGTPLGTEGAEWLAIHLCNLAGADKEIVGGEYRTRTPQERAEWTRGHSDLICSVAQDPLGCRSWHLVGGFGLQKIKRGRVVPVAIDKPWQFLAACFEWAAYQEEGVGFRSRLAGALDGSCSGVQMLAGMTRDKSAGAMVNLVPAPRGDDYYGRMAAALSKRLCEAAPKADVGTLAHLTYWAEQTIDRDLLKAPSMTKVYSAGTYTFGEQVQDKTEAPEAEAMWLAAQINACFTDVAPGMLRAMAYLQEVADVMTAEGLPLAWVTPAGLRVVQARYGSRTVRLMTRIGAAGTERRRDFSVATADLSKNAQRAGVAPNFVHGVDASHMAMTVNDLHTKGVRNFWMIHDSFGAPFAHCLEVFSSTREQFVKLMDGDLLGEWAAAVTANLPDDKKTALPQPPMYGELDVSAVRDSVYAWF